MGLLLTGKTPHQAFIDSFGGFDSDCPHVVVEFTDDPQNALTVPPAVAELMKPACKCANRLRKGRLSKPLKVPRRFVKVFQHVRSSFSQAECLGFFGETSWILCAVEKGSQAAAAPTYGLSST